jgi:hypothetical protein
VFEWVLRASLERAAGVGAGSAVEVAMHLRDMIVALLTFSSAWAAPAPDAAVEPAHELAVWVPMQLNFVYRHSTTQYSCSGLEARMKNLLLKLGARPDLDVRGYGCTRLSGPDPLAGVKVRMNVLEVAGPRPGVGAHWKRVDLLGDRDLMEAAADCELIEQVAEKILPLFTVRNVDYNATCQARSPLPGSTRLQADVLTADQRPSPPSVAR